MNDQIEIGDTTVEVVRKAIKNVHLSVHPPTGRVTIAAPARMSLETLRAFTITKLPWIRRQQAQLQAQERETEREYLERESHYVWGRRHLLKLVETERSPAVTLTPRCLILHVRPGWDEARRGEFLEAWYRDQLRAAAAPVLAQWESRMGLKAERLFVQRMKTKWGSCNPNRRTLRLNTDLAKKPPECLEYLIVHELCHFFEPTHSPRFIALLDSFLPQWRSRRQTLNSLPIRHVEWRY
jgi:predicted metal-dependent hydrolase